ncbi:hypothetical protein ACTMS0_07410 [Micromonospora sp. H33]|uniref:hypothetical protein n=1 Tax=Micromonospora sp. H33 TaxID=3452215 RepID=UPI003F8ADBB0
MDLAVVLARWLAGPIARFLDVDGKTPEERRAEVIEYATLPGEDVDELGLRHVTRSTAWFILCGAAFVVAAVVVIPISAFASERVKDLAFDIAEWVIFFPFFMAAVHGVKMLVARYLPERRWNPASRLWRAVMLAQTPDYMLAALLTAASALWW